MVVHCCLTARTSWEPTPPFLCGVSQNSLQLFILLKHDSSLLLLKHSVSLETNATHASLWKCLFAEWGNEGASVVSYLLRESDLILLQLPRKHIWGTRLSLEHFLTNWLFDCDPTKRLPGIQSLPERREFNISADAVILKLISSGCFHCFRFTRLSEVSPVIHSSWWSTTRF